MKNVPTTEGSPVEELVTLAKPGGERDVTLFTAAGPIRFHEGRAHGVPLAGPGWSIEPLVKLKETDQRSNA